MATEDQDHDPHHDVGAYVHYYDSMVVFLKTAHFRELEEADRRTVEEKMNAEDTWYQSRYREDECGARLRALRTVIDPLLKKVGFEIHDPE
ncbi:hypothetical protein LRS74_15620 [Streptomyces sp. LX-29]|uniref:hypothetical protein n=1 Tax=Streptomyces sp. LX-29 TaxID=2900152 RepID=UPI00240D9A93|nr:hypothetical protein [Streptomyces sp. LX-29]WFB08324.1 hypothetical protein LRS74_15620 [Streptomyces sp. LX-29]